MTTMTIRGLDDQTRARLRIRAAEHGHSMEAEVREILRTTLAPPVTSGFGTHVHARFAAAGGADLDLPPRTEMPRPLDLEE